MRHGAKSNPANRFEALWREVDGDYLDQDPEFAKGLHRRRIEYVFDASKSIVSENDSPDLPFRYSVNPYRGCAHGCAYCYARPTHEYLGFSAGLDFETRILVKRDAPRLLRDFLRRKAWRPEPITFSGVTDCYQPAERQFRLTRGCLEVAWEHRQPVTIVTKNALVLRDLDLLQPMARANLVHVFVSITTLLPELAREMEPRTSTPAARFRAVAALAEHGVPVGVMIAPVIPALNDSEIPAILAAARDAGALRATYVLLRLPLTVEPVFRDWLENVQPDSAGRVLSRLEACRGGKRNDSVWGRRMVGEGTIAEQIRRVFQVYQKRYALDRPMPPLDCSNFRREGEDPLPLFDKAD